MRRPSRIAALACVASALLAGACDPACEPYWKKVCERCDNSGCDLAKKRAKDSLGDSATCEAATRDLDALLAEPGAKNVVCSMPVKGGLPTKALFGSWRCGDRELTITPSSLTVDKQSFEVVQLAMSFVNLKVAGSSQTTCKLKLEGERLALSCATALGALGDRASCTRAGATSASAAADPTTCTAAQEGGARCSGDGTRMLECKDGRVTTAHWCRGPKGCTAGDIGPDCDESRAKLGDPCVDEFGLSAPTSVDGPEELACTGGVWALRKASSAAPSALPR